LAADPPEREHVFLAQLDHLAGLERRRSAWRSRSLRVAVHIALGLNRRSERHGPLVLPLTFVSSAYVPPVDRLPGVRDQSTAAARGLCERLHDAQEFVAG
jgi:hypothetical protein